MSIAVQRNSIENFSDYANAVVMAVGGSLPILVYVIVAHIHISTYNAKVGKVNMHKRIYIVTEVAV